MWDDVLTAKLEILLTNREFPLPLIGAEALDPWFAGVASQRSAIKYLIDRMSAAGAQLVEIDGIEYLSFLSQEEWDKSLTSARHLLAGGVEAKWSKADCKHYVTTLLPARTTEFAGLLWEAASKWCHFSDDTEEGTLAAYGRGVEQIVEAVLQEADSPLHYSEIAVRASKRVGRDVDERRAHNAAAEVGYLFGPGTYGLLKHLAVSRAEREAIADEAADFVIQGPSTRQWHASELIDALTQQGIGLPPHFDKYQLDIALKEQGDLTSLGRMVWSIDEGTTRQARVDIRQAVIAILQHAGTPLSTSELRQRLIAVRGVNQGMYLHAVDPLIKLDAQTWGLNDRDLNIKLLDQPAYIDRIASRLREIGRPVHLSECEAVFGSDISSRAIFGLAQTDPRLEISPDRHLKLKTVAALG